MSNFHDDRTNFTEPVPQNNWSAGSPDPNRNHHNNNRRGGAVVIVSIALVMLILGGLLGVVLVQGLQPDAQLGSEATATPAPTATPPIHRAPDPAQKFSMTEKDGTICSAS